MKKRIKRQLTRDKWNKLNVNKKRQDNVICTVFNLCQMCVLADAHRGVKCANHIQILLCLFRLCFIFFFSVVIIFSLFFLATQYIFLVFTCNSLNVLYFQLHCVIICVRLLYLLVVVPASSRVAIAVSLALGHLLQQLGIAIQVIYYYHFLYFSPSYLTYCQLANNFLPCVLFHSILAAYAVLVQTLYGNCETRYHGFRQHCMAG